MKKNTKIWMASFFMMLSVTAFSQFKRVAVEGVIQNGEKEGLIAATVVLLNPVDSVLISYGTTDVDGYFKIRNVAPQKVRMQISYLGFGTIEKIVEIPADSAVYKLGIITLSESSNLLEEIVVKGEFIPITIKKDTIEYNADAYRLRPNASVEDLLKKLPGIEVDEQGVITAQGETINNITVDGKKFFGNDPKMATQNIPADAVKKVQVFDRRSDKATFTGVSDGEAEKTINLELKPDRKVGTFGDLLVGAGTNSRYDSKLSVNKFNDKFQLSFIGKLNNLNNSGFSQAEMGSLTGFGGRGGGGLVNTGSSGLTQSGNIGTNIFYQFSPKYSITTSYFLTQSDQFITNLSDKQNFTPVRNYLSTEDNSSNTDRLGHNVSVDLQAKPDSFNIVRLQSSLRFDKTNQGNLGLISTSGLDGVISSLTDQADSTISNNKNLSFSLNWTRRFRKAGRSLSFNGTLGNTVNDSDYELDQEFTEGGLVSNILQNQLSNTTNDNYLVYGEFREQLSRSSNIGVSASIRNFRSLQDKLFYNLDRQDLTIRELDETLSSLADNNTDYQRAAILYSHDTENHNFNMDLGVQRSVISNNSGIEKINKPFIYFMPALTYNLTEQRIRFRYSTSVNEPSTRQLQSIFDNSDPLNSYQGNPDLKPEYSHRFNVRYFFFDNFNFRNIFASLDLSQSTNSIVNSRVVDPVTFRSFSTPINTKSAQSGSLNFTFSSPIRALAIKSRLTTGFSLSKNINIINSAFNDVVTSSPRVGLELENTKNEILSVVVGTNLSLRSNKYSVSTTQNNNVKSQQYYGNLGLNFGKTWFLEGNISHSIFDASNSDTKTELTMATSSLTKRFMNDRLSLKLSVADIFNVGKGITQNVTNTYVEELTTNNLGRYGLLTASYRISGFGPTGGGPGGGGGRGPGGGGGFMIRN